MTKLTKGISVVIPLYNSADILPQLASRVDAVLKSMNLPYEVILVNDGSGDNSWEMAQESAARYPEFRGINLMRNYGQHNALLCGIRAALYDVVVTMDDDLQNPPEEIGKLVSKLDEGSDVVYGTPEREHHGILRDLASLMTKIALQDVMGVSTARSVSAFRAFRTITRNAFEKYRSPFVSIDVLLTWGASHFTSVIVRQDDRAAGTSQYTLGKLIRHALNMLTGFSVLPLQMAAWMGFVFMIFGLLVLLYVIGQWLLRGSVVPGFPFLASIIALFSGAQLFALGIIGEYLARMHFRMMERPAYSVRSTTTVSNEP